MAIGKSNKPWIVYIILIIIVVIVIDRLVNHHIIQLNKIENSDQ